MVIWYEPFGQGPTEVHRAVTIQDHNGYLAPSWILVPDGADTGPRTKGTDTGQSIVFEIGVSIPKTIAVIDTP